VPNERTLGPWSSMVICTFLSVSSRESKFFSVDSTGTRDRRGSLEVSSVGSMLVVI